MSYIYIFIFIVSLACLIISLFLFTKSVYTAHERTLRVRETLTEKESLSVSQKINIMSDNNISLSLIASETNKNIASINIYPCIIGRSNQADIAIRNDLTISNRHAAFTCKNNSIYIEDLKSTNGTFVNDNKLFHKKKIENGDKIRIGQTEINLIITIKHNNPMESDNVNGR